MTEREFYIRLQNLRADFEAEQGAGRLIGDAEKTTAILDSLSTTEETLRIEITKTADGKVSR